MRTQAVVVAVCLSSMVLALGVGCVSKEQYEKLDAAYRKCDEHREQLQQELQAEKDNVAALNSQLEALRSQMGGSAGELDRLRKENEALTAANEKLKAAAEAALSTPIAEPQVIVRKLPAELHKALQDFAKKYPDMVEYDAKRGAVKWKSDLVFALGSDVVRDSAKPSLQAFAKVASSSAAAKFDCIVVGHTDNLRIAREETRRLHPTNWHLSVHRAIAVNNLLMQFGVSKTRTGVMGYGEYRPIASNANDAGRQKNRRVEIFLVNRQVLGVSQTDGVYRVKDTGLVFARPK
jgi:chemotaxis protein MotB